jgi:hypothetical protein
MTGAAITRRLATAVVAGFLCCVALGGCGGGDPISHGATLGGRWTSPDYTCPVGVRHTEIVDIDERGSQLTATKVVGDLCVPAGHVSFTGEVSGRSGLVAFWAAQLGGVPTLGPQTQQLHVISEGRFTVQFAGVGTMTFTQAATAHHGGTFPWWLWVLLIVVVIAVTVLGYRRVRR